MKSQIYKGFGEILNKENISGQIYQKMSTPICSQMESGHTECIKGSVRPSMAMGRSHNEKSILKVAL